MNDTMTFTGLPKSEIINKQQVTTKNVNKYGGHLMNEV